MSDYVKCENCKYEENCPAGWSYCNSACLMIQREKEDHQKTETGVIANNV